MRQSSIIVGLLLAGAAWAPGVSSAVVLSGGDGAPPANDTDPDNGVPWDRVGALGNGTGVWLGDSDGDPDTGYVLTAAHVNRNTDLTLGNNTYRYTGGGRVLDNPDSEDLTDSADLWIGQYTRNSGSDVISDTPLTLTTATPDDRDTGLLVATGHTETTSTEQTYYVNQLADPDDWDTEPFVGATSNYQGFRSDGPRAKRYGEATITTRDGEVQVAAESSGRDIVGYFSEFLDEAGSAQGASGDSGSPLFFLNPDTNEWELGGVAHGIAGYENQFDDEDLPATAIYGNLTLFSDLSTPAYADQINALTSATVPEPGTLALVGLGGLAMLRRRRRVI